MNKKMLKCDGCGKETLILWDDDGKSHCVKCHVKYIRKQ